MRASLMTAVALAAALAVSGVASAPTAHADDACATFQDNFEVVSATVDRTAVSPHGLTPAPVTFTVTTKAEVWSSPPAEHPNVWGALELQDTRTGWDGPKLALKKIAAKGDLATWRGVLQASGPSRSVVFDQVVGQIATCYRNSSTHLPPIHITATGTPVIRVDRVAPVALTARSYVLRGRVTDTKGASFGRRFTIRVARDIVGAPPEEGTAVRTDKTGRFAVTLANARPATPDWHAPGAPVIDAHSVRLPGPGRDALGRPADLARTAVAVPWWHTFAVAAPTTIKRGVAVTVRSSAPLPAWTAVQLERLHGRSAWRQVGWGPIRASGRLDTETTPDLLGAHTYRLRTADGKAVSKPFVMTTRR